MSGVVEQQQIKMPENRIVSSNGKRGRSRRVGPPLPGGQLHAAGDKSIDQPGVADQDDPAKGSIFSTDFLTQGLRPGQQPSFSFPSAVKSPGGAAGGTKKEREGCLRFVAPEPLQPAPGAFAQQGFPAGCQFNSPGNNCCCFPGSLQITAEKQIELTGSG